MGRPSSIGSTTNLALHREANNTDSNANLNNSKEADMSTTPLEKLLRITYGF